MSYASPQGVSLSNVSASASSVTLFSQSELPRGRYVFNDSTATLYIKFGTTASATSHTVQVSAGSFYEFPDPVYGGRVDGIWSSATGTARLTEVSA